MVSKPAGDVPQAGRGHYRLRLFESFGLEIDGAEIALKSREQRLVALLALEGGRTRSYLAGMLWPDSTEGRAAGSLRAAVWRLEREAPGLLRSYGGQLALDPSVTVDVAQFSASANRIAVLIELSDDDFDDDSDGDADGGSGGGECLTVLDILLRGDLLSGWYDDWVLYERARLQQVRVCALESVAELLIDRGQLAAALTAALRATAIEPLRESAHRLLVRVHLANGNFHDAIRAYRAFGGRLVGELGIRPSRQMDALVRPLLDRQAVSAAPDRLRPRAASAVA
jgi:DNA-binding SARP family transcriptional activator